MSIDTIYNIVTVAILTGDVLFVVLAFVFSGKKVKALEQENQKDAIMYETTERLYVGMACALFAVALLNINHSTTVNGLCIVIQKLEVLLRGR